jgi:hypothetical protein
MNKAIKTLVESIEASKDSYNRVNQELQTKLQTELNKKFDKSKELKTAVAELENSTEYISDDAGEISRFIRFDVPTDFKPFTNELNNWFSEAHGLYLDTGSSPSQYTILKSYCGECIVVNEDGDVFDGHKVIIDSDNCKNEDGDYDESKRNEMIEAYMERTGCFPDVLRQTQYGDLFPINTKETK